MSVFETIEHHVNQGKTVVVLTVTDTTGSTPRDIGARMVVTQEDTAGTIGGGHVEGLAVQTARNVLSGEEDSGIRTYELTPDGNTGMFCGGTMDILIDRIQGKPQLHIAGGGHVGSALAKLAETLGYSITVIDDREEYARQDYFPDSTTVIQDQYSKALSSLPLTDQTAIVVATRSSALDQKALQAALDGNPGYIGLIASKKKADHILETLEEKGYNPPQLREIHSPAGLDLGGGRPEDIALSLLGEIHVQRHGASAQSFNRHDFENLSVVRGGGDLGSGVVYRLHQAGYPVIVTEVSNPTVVRRAVAFGSAVYEENITIQGVTGKLVSDVQEAFDCLQNGNIPVLVAPSIGAVTKLNPTIIVDAIMAKGKYDTGTQRDLADIVIGLGPGFTAGEDVDAVIETHRGHELGQAIYDGKPQPYDGTPGERKGYTHERVLRAPVDGTWNPEVSIGTQVEEESVLGYVGNTPVKSEIDGVVRGLVHGGLDVNKEMKLGDVDPRSDIDCQKISDKALSLGGGVLEAILRHS